MQDLDECSEIDEIAYQLSIESNIRERLTISSIELDIKL
jgi:hypothetical protein